MRLIDADELRRKMCYVCIDTDEETEKGRAKWDSGLWIRYKVFEDTLILTPTVEAEPIRHGHWIVDEDGNITCSECGHHGVGDNYCERCGAKMDEVSEDES